MFNVPNVNQFKPEIIFGNALPRCHYDFIKNLVGKKDNREILSEMCNEYYEKDPNVDYWGRIITLFRFGGYKKVKDNIIVDIPLQDFIQRQYNNDKTEFSDLWLNYFLCKWEFPHPLTASRKRHKYINMLKPYSLILSLLIELYYIDSSFSFITEDEFYWLGTVFEKEEKLITQYDAKECANEVVNIRESGGYKDYEKVTSKNTKIGYPQKLLSLSKVLTYDQASFVAPENRKVFICLDRTYGNYLKHASELIQYSNNTKFQYDIEESKRSESLEANWSDYLNEPTHLINWIKSIHLYSDDYAKKLSYAFYGK